MKDRSDEVESSSRCSICKCSPSFRRDNVEMCDVVYGLSGLGTWVAVEEKPLPSKRERAVAFARWHVDSSRWKPFPFRHSSWRSDVGSK